MPIHNEMMVIYIDQSNMIADCQGNVVDVFGIAPHGFAKAGMHAMQIPWEEVVEHPPNMNQTRTVLRSRGGHLVMLSVVRLPRETEPLSYLLLLCRLDNLLETAGDDPSGLELDKETLFRSEKMNKIIDIIHKIANVDSTVMLQGESGVGKTMLAQFIHRVSSRKDKPFISVNCGTLPDSLIESELFGYEAGSFTGGKAEGKKGLLEVAEGGTIFLDEIAELPFHVQSKLLEVIQENTYRKIGSVEKRTANIRVIVATNKNLRELVTEKHFREDLYYRLHVVPLTIPPLRERREEILPLTERFLQIFNRKYNRRHSLSTDVKQKFLEYDWPGNVRELENTVERMVVTHSVEVVEQWGQPTAKAGTSILAWAGGADLPSLKDAKKQLEKELILRAYDLYENTYRAAEALQVDQSTIVKKLKQYRDEGGAGFG